MPEIFGEPMKLAGFSGCGKGDEPEPSGAPVNTQQASFAPLPPREGDTVEVNEGQWSSDTPITYTYQWQLDGVDIAGATLKTLLILPEMAGLALRCVVTATNVAGSAISTTVSAVVAAINYVARLDGTSQEWVFDNSIDVPNEAYVLLDLILSRNTTQVIYGGGSSPERLYIGTENGNWLIGNGTDRVDTLAPAPLNTKVKTVLELSGGVFKFSVDDFVVYEQPIKYSASKSLSGISNLAGFRLYGAAFNFSIKSNGSLVNEIPLTNKDQGATQTATAGTVSATMINYTEAVWEEIPDE